MHFDNVLNNCMAHQMKVEVYYAGLEKHFKAVVELSVDSSMQDAIDKSGILHEYPEIDLDVNRVGVFSEFRTLQDKVYEGDRVEIYRPLKADPKESRRNRARSSEK